MVDLKGQYADIKQEVDTSIQEIIDNTAFINGPKVHQFQKNLENKEAVPLQFMFL